MFGCVEFQAEIDIRKTMINQLSQVVPAAGYWVINRSDWFTQGNFSLSYQLKLCQKLFFRRVGRPQVVKVKDIYKFLFGPLNVLFRVFALLNCEVNNALQLQFDEGRFTDSLNWQDIWDANEASKLAEVVELRF